MTHAKVLDGWIYGMKPYGILIPAVIVAGRGKMKADPMLTFAITAMVTGAMVMATRSAGSARRVGCMTPREHVGNVRALERAPENTMKMGIGRVGIGRLGARYVSLARGKDGSFAKCAMAGA